MSRPRHARPGAGSLPTTPFVVAAVLAVLAPSLTVLGGPALVRGPAVAAFLILAPGLVVVPRLRLTVTEGLALVPVVSLATVTLVSMATAYLGVWSTLLTVSVIAGAVFAGAAAQILLASGPAYPRGGQ